MDSLLSSLPNTTASLSSASEVPDVRASLPLLLLGPLLQLAGSILLLPWAPHSVTSSPRRLHKWRSTWLARLAAGVSGLWAVLALHSSYQLRADLMLGTSPAAVRLIVFSLGVHIAETVDMAATRQLSLLSLHHVAVILCFAGALASSKAIGFAVLTLVTELNAVTNKTRILHIVTLTSTRSLQYRINAIVNIITFFLRILIIFWMNNQSLLYFVQEPSLFLAVCSAGILFVNMWNLTVFKTLFVRDILQKPKEQ